jgi:hypothetical protein
MAKKKKLMTKLTPKPQLPIVQQSEESTMPATTPSNEPPAKGRTQQVIKRLRDSFIDWALDNIWWGLLFAVTSIITLIWLYMRGGGAAWIYPYFNFALGFLSACITLVLTSLFVSYIKARRLKHAKHLKFVSHEKGYLDHAVNKEKAISDFLRILNEMGEEIERIANTSNTGTARIEAATARRKGNLAIEGHKITANTAMGYDKHSIKMERQLAALEEVFEILAESQIGYMTWFTPTTQEQREQLVNERQALNKLRDITRTTIASTEGFRDSQISTKGISQVLNTAINRLVNVTEGIIAVMRKAENLWEELITIIDGKLSS